jgi:hypothetical protein
MLAQAMDYWAEGCIEQSLSTLALSLALKKTALAITFREFVIYQSSQDIVELLATQQLLVAKNNLGKIESLLPQSHTLQKINSLADYLLFTK